jgi:UPF0176 protein
MLHTAFYRFTPVPDPEAEAQCLRRVLPPLLGSVLVAQEGINAVLAGDEEAVQAAEARLQTDPAFEGRWAGMHFKRSTCLTPPFGRLAVHVKPEIVAVGLDEIPLPLRPPSEAGSLSPAQWRELLTQPDVVLLDNRNHFEFQLGHFEGAINPGVRHFRDFPAYVREHAPRWKAQGQRVAMYCTGGIRCEKTAGWMQQELGLQVHQLEGGILNYFEQMKDAGRDWVGECYVFDNRVALDTRLEETDTTAEDVFAQDPQEAWRLARAQRLQAQALSPAPKAKGPTPPTEPPSAEATAAPSPRDFPAQP